MVAHPKSVDRLVGVRSISKKHDRAPNLGHTTLAGRADMVRRVMNGEKPSEFAPSLGVDVTTVYRWVRRYKAGLSLDDKPKSGRPRSVLTKINLQLIYDTVKATKPPTNACAILNIAEASKHEVLLHPRTYRDAKKELKITGRPRKKKLFLTPKQMVLRVNHYEENKHKTPEDWGCHLIVDEFLGKNVPHKVQQCVPGQEPDPMPRWKNEVQVMFVGGISMVGGKTPLYHCPFKPQRRRTMTCV